MPRSFPTGPSAPFLAPRIHVSRIMLEVALALVPGIAALHWQFGPGILIQCLIALIFAELAEATVLLLRRRPLAPTLGDYSAVLTALLLAVSLPPLSPWWLTAFGSVFAIIVGKQLYGGLGYNPFNPAMVGYAALLVSFPRPMTAWLPPVDLNTTPLDFAATWNAILFRELPAGLSFDALAGATPLDLVKTQASRERPLTEVLATAYRSGEGWRWANLGFLLGGFGLLYRRRIPWQIPAGFLGALSAAALLAFASDPEGHPPLGFHLLSGGTMLGAFFIATDPVSAATTPRGRLIYGAAIGFLVFVIRNWGGYPDGVAFAVLLLNLAVPTLDHYTRPRVYGHPR